MVDMHIEGKIFLELVLILLDMHVFQVMFSRDLP